MRSRALTAAAAAAALAAPAVAHAHGGSILLDRTVGPYDAALAVSEPARGGGRPVDYTVTLRSGGQPEEGARVRLRVRADGRWSRPYPAERGADAYEVVLAQPERGAWRDWDVEVAIDGPAGRASARAEAPGEPGGGAPAGLVAGTAAALTTLALAVVAIRRRRTAADG